MNEAYQIFGSEMSPYSVKVRSYARYKAIPDARVVRRADNDGPYRRYARLPKVRPPTDCPHGSEGDGKLSEILETAGCAARLS